MDPQALSISIAFSSLLVILTLVTGIFMAITPFLMPKRECFTVTVPDAAASDRQLRSYKITFALIVFVVSALFTIGSAIAFLLGAMEAGIAIAGAGILITCCGGYALMLFFRKKVRAYKQAQGWAAQTERTAATIGDESSPRAISLKWDLLFLPFVIACIVVCALGYNAIPDQIPRQVGFTGEVTSYFTKSPVAAAFPALVVIFIDAILFISHWMILRSKKAIDPAAPAASAWAYGMFAKAQSVLLVATGVLVGFVGLFIALSFVGAITIQQAAIMVLVPIFAIVVGSIALSLAYGQNGSRLLAKAATSDAISQDNDRFWKLGIFYVNRNDPSLFLPERVGIGWTMNWGRPGAGGGLALTVGIVVAFVAGILTLI